jgi:hypothetical protein
VLLAIVLLSLLPVLLLLIDVLVTRGATIQLPGVSLSFAQASEEAAARLRTTTLSENLGVSDDVTVAQTSLRSVLRALRRAHDSEMTVVDLRKGRTWWETRLCVLVAGAASRDRPQAIAFIADRNGRAGAFLGWASPSSLLELHRSAEPSFANAHDRALALAAQWRLGIPPADGHSTYVVLPWNSAQLHLPALADDVSDPAFALELFLQQQLEQANPELRRYVTAQRLLELYEPVLVTDRVEADADDETWARTLSTSPRRFFAVTAADTLRTLVPRDVLTGALVARLAGAMTARPDPAGPDE